jgi:hypothetical protein
MRSWASFQGDGVEFLEAGLVFADDVEGFEVGDFGGEDGGFEAGATGDAPLGVADLLD